MAEIHVRVQPIAASSIRYIAAKAVQILDDPHTEELVDTIVSECHTIMRQMGDRSLVDGAELLRDLTASEWKAILRGQ